MLAKSEIVRGVQPAEGNHREKSQVLQEVVNPSPLTITINSRVASGKAFGKGSFA